MKNKTNKSRKEALKIKEIVTILDQYWLQKVKKITGTKERKRFYSEDYIQGFNMCIFQLVEKRVLTKNMLYSIFNIRE